MSSRPGYISLARDHNPYTTLLYGNGPGAHTHRPDLRHIDTSKFKDCRKSQEWGFSMF